MDKVKAIDIVNGEVESDDATYIKACQYLIDTGDAWIANAFVASKCLQMLQQRRCHRNK